jgi:hypothetical protein
MVHGAFHGNKDDQRSMWRLTDIEAATFVAVVVVTVGLVWVWG